MVLPLTRITAPWQVCACADKIAAHARPYITKLREGGRASEEQEHASSPYNNHSWSRPIATSKIQETTSTTAAAVPAMMEEEEERYVKVGSRFFKVKPRDGGSSMARRLHYLESCFLCKKTIACNRDIFMYKGDAAFCSEDCRLDQMDMDEALDAVARRHRLLRMPPSSQQAAGDASRPPMMRRRPTIANLAARNPPVAAT